MKNIVTHKEESFSTSKGDFYDRIETMSQTAAFTNEELHEYHQWLKVTNDERLRLQRAEQKGLAEGEAKGRAEGEAKGRAEGLVAGEKAKAWQSAHILYEKNMSLDFIQEVTGLSIEELRQEFD